MATPATSSSQKIAFITGGNRGIGFETARQLGALGILPVIGVRSADAAQNALAQLRDFGVQAEAIVFDATIRADRQKAYDFFEAKAGRLDILINNAGVYLEGEPGVATDFSASNLP